MFFIFIQNNFFFCTIYCNMTNIHNSQASRMILAIYSFYYFSLDMRLPYYYEKTKFLERCDAKRTSLLKRCKQLSKRVWVRAFHKARGS
ncbi:hypothetical protein HanRHA438_Chr12g0548621 [Helianthus annuus]|nr:hypothetical protein HanRHA438_Chr12g0548621 [Helianthus annuus]